MTPDTAAGVIKNLDQSGLIQKTLNISWHAGEPLTLPPSYYEEMTSAISEVIPDGCEVKYIFQTNGTLLSEAWCDFLFGSGAHVGVSIDGPKEIHDRYRVDRKGRGTFDRVANAIELLKEANIPYYALSVLTKDSLRQPKRLFDFFVEAGIKNVCFNIEELEGENRINRFAGLDVYADAKLFFEQYYELLKASHFPHWVRELNYAFNGILKSDLSGRNALITPTSSINVDYMGNFSTFSPELLGVITQKYGKIVFGNLNRDSLLECLQREPYASVSADIALGVERCRVTCEYFPVCGGGSPANKLFENGSFDSSETNFCRFSIKAATDAALTILESQLTDGSRCQPLPWSNLKDVS